MSTAEQKKKLIITTEVIAFDYWEQPDWNNESDKKEFFDKLQQEVKDIFERSGYGRQSELVVRFDVC